MVQWLGELSFLPALAYASVLFVPLTLLSLAIGYFHERAARADSRVVFELPLKRGQTRNEVVGNLLWHLMWMPAFALVVSNGVLRFGEGIWLDLATFFLCVYSFQMFYWLMHRAMHWRPLFFMHKWHHDSLVTTPLTGFSIHPLEGIGWIACFVGPAAFVSLFTEVGAWGYLMFVIVGWSGNIVGHANAEFMPSISSTHWGSRLFGNPVSYHCLHHARFDRHYGFATSWMDAIFRTQWPDWIAVAKRVRGGAPLTKLRERVKTSEAAGA